MNRGTFKMLGSQVCIKYGYIVDNFCATFGRECGSLFTSFELWSARGQNIILGVIPKSPLPTRADQLSRERAFLFSGSARDILRRGRPLRPEPKLTGKSFCKGPRLMKDEARLISVNAPVASASTSYPTALVPMTGVPLSRVCSGRWLAPSLDDRSLRHGSAVKAELCPGAKDFTILDESFKRAIERKRMPAREERTSITPTPTPHHYR